MENLQPAEPSVPQKEPQIKQIIPSNNYPQSSSKLKWILIAAFLIILLIISLGGAYYLGLRNNQKSLAINPSGGTNRTITPTITSATPDPTANWKTYTGFDYSFKYPTTWLTDNKQVYDPTTAVKGGSGVPQTYYKTQLSFFEQKTNLTVDQYANQNYGNRQGFEINNLSINGLDGKSFYNPIGEGTFGWYVGISNGNTLFIFGPSNKNIIQDPIFNQIVNSFRFINQPSQTDLTANWKTYTNTTYGFQIKYPLTGTIINQQGQSTNGNCGNEIKNDPNPPGAPITYALIVDNFFEVWVQPWQGTINDYLSKYAHSPIRPISGSNADEAVTSANPGYSINGATISIYKKSGNLFFINSIQNPGNSGGCTAQGEELNLIENSFKFTQ